MLLLLLLFFLFYILFMLLLYIGETLASIKRIYRELLLKSLQIAGHAVMISVPLFLTIPTILLDDVYQYC